MLRAMLQPLAGAGGGAAAAAALGRQGATPYSTSALQWLDRFVNYEQRGVPAAAGTDSGAGFDLVRLICWLLKGTESSACLLDLAPDQLAAPRCPQGRMRCLLADLGDPQRAWPAVHVAGTKGKGSTTAMVAGILHAAGYRAGAYTRCGPQPAALTMLV